MGDESEELFIWPGFQRVGMKNEFGLLNGSFIPKKQRVLKGQR